MIIYQLLTDEVTVTMPGMVFRFVHTADIHLDSPLRSLALRDPEIAEMIGNATRQAFERTVELCLEERRDALIIADDLYDGDLRSTNKHTEAGITAGSHQNPCPQTVQRLIEGHFDG